MYTLCFSLLSYGSVSKHSVLFQTQGNSCRSVQNSENCLWKLNSISYALHVFKWFRRCRMECENLENDSRSELLSTAQNLEIVTEFLDRWAGIFK